MRIPVAEVAAVPQAHRNLKQIAALIGSLKRNLAPSQASNLVICITVY